MARLSSRHSNTEVIMFSDFSGGLNFAKPPETISGNELQEAINFEFAPDTGMLRVRGGITHVYSFEDTVTDIMPIAGESVALVRAGNKIHRLTYSQNNSHAEHIGEVNGSKPVSYELWSDGHHMIMAFGGNLFMYDGMNLNKIDGTDAPTAVEILFSRGGRIIVGEANSDKIRYSGVGDPTKWVEGNAADSVSLDIGYKDGCKLKAIASIAGELIIFKAPDGQPEYGRIYRLQGDYPNWNLVHHSRGASAWNAQSVASVTNDIVFLTREGLGNFATATEFGDYKLGWAGSKVNPKLSPQLNNNCRLWSLPLKGQLWVSSGNSNEVWVHHYQIGGGAWTTFNFHGNVRAVAASGGYVYLGIGNDVYRMEDENPNDGGVPIHATLKPRTIFKKNQILVKSVMVGYQSTETSEPKMKIDKFTVPLPQGGQNETAFGDFDVALHDEDPLVPAVNNAVVRRRCNIRRWSITPEVDVMSGSFSLSFLGLEVSEV